MIYNGIYNGIYNDLHNVQYPLVGTIYLPSSVILRHILDLIEANIGILNDLVHNICNNNNNNFILIRKGELIG